MVTKNEQLIIAENQFSAALQQALQLNDIFQGKPFTLKELRKSAQANWKNIERVTETLVSYGLLERNEKVSPNQYSVRLDPEFRMGAFSFLLDQLDQQYYEQKRQLDYLCYFSAQFNEKVWEALVLKLDYYSAYVKLGPEDLRVESTTAAVNSIRSAMEGKSLVWVKDLPVQLQQSFLEYITEAGLQTPEGITREQICSPLHCVKNWILDLIDRKASQMFSGHVTFANVTVNDQATAWTQIMSLIEGHGRHFMRPPYDYQLPGNIRKCRKCGCTDLNCQQCIEKTGHPCHWVEQDLCSACAVPNKENPENTQNSPEDQTQDKEVGEITDQPDIPQENIPPDSTKRKKLKPL